MNSVQKFLSVAVVLLGIAVVSSSCRGSGHSDMPALSVDQLSAMMAGESAPVVLDANSSQVRAEYGVIPGATLLTSYADYDVATELPEDTATPLVFYCSSTRCSAAPKAADRAISAGYTNVSVLPEGIKGWVEAGKPVDKTERES